ncbi:MAG: ribbon-helix-helix domain-containing protein [Tissierellales bacterium]
MERYRANVYFDPEVRRRAKELADRMGLSFSAFVNMAVFEYLKQCSVMELSDIFKRVLDREIMTIKRSEERER